MEKENEDEEGLSIIQATRLAARRNFFLETGELSNGVPYPLEGGGTDDGHSGCFPAPGPAACESLAFLLACHIG